MSQVITETPRPVAPLEYGRPGAPSKAALWTGRVISALPVLALAISAVFKFLPPNADVIKGMDHVGWPMRLMFGLGILEISCALLYAIPRTAVLGAILVTGYMGGAIATHLRVGDNFVIQALIPFLAWLGLFLRDPRLRALLPLRTRP